MTDRKKVLSWALEMAFEKALMKAFLRACEISMVVKMEPQLD